MRLSVFAQPVSCSQVSSTRRLRAGLGLAVLAMMCLAAAGCATTPDTPSASANAGPGDAVSQRLAEVSAAAGSSVSSFRYLGQATFEPIGLRDLIVFNGPSEAYLLHLDGSCRDLDFDPLLKLTSHMHRVSTLTDSVIVRDNPIPCRIERISRVDTTKIQATKSSASGQFDTSVGTH